MADDRPVRAGDLHVERIDVARVVDAFAFAVDDRRCERAGDALHEVRENRGERALFLIAARYGGHRALAMIASAAGSIATGVRRFWSARSAT